MWTSLLLFVTNELICDILKSYYYIFIVFFPCLLPLPHISASLPRSIATLLHGICISVYDISNGRKNVRWSAVPVPCLCRLYMKLGEGAGQRPQRGWWPMLSHIWGNFSFSSLRLGFGPQGWIKASRLEYGRRGRDLVVETGFWASRLRFRTQA